MNTYLSQTLSAYLGGNSSTVHYVFPTTPNMSAGNYLSEILDIQEVLRLDGSLEALDFYHKLTDGNGNDLYVRFRYYEKELPGLAQALKNYPAVERWRDTVGLLEDVAVTPKTMGNYLRISHRALSATGTTPLHQPAQSIGTTTSAGSPAKKGISLSKMPKKHLGGSQLSSRRSELLEDDDDDFDADLDDMDD